MITLLTSASYGVTHTSRMPSTDASDLTKTSVSLTGKAGDAPTGDNAGETVTASGGADVDDFTLSEKFGDLYLLLEKSLGEFDLGGNITTIDLDLKKVGNLGSQLHFADLGMGKDTHDVAVLLDAVNLGLNLLGFLGGLLCILGKSLLFRVIPILVESAFDLFGQVTGPDGGEGAKTVGCGDIADNADNNHGR